MIYLFERKNKTLFHFLRINNIYLQKYDILRFTDLTLMYLHSTVKLGDKVRLDSEQPSVSEQFCDDQKVPYRQV